ncbi:MAG: hypothetical protein KGL39_43295 [Patescibacteria group bacterium]|nr:hypothetical protein [Patescibacteria group bacterium]
MQKHQEQVPQLLVWFRSMTPYIVALTFADGRIAINAMIAENREAASALWVSAYHQMTQAEGKPLTAPLSGIAVMELPADFLRDALRAAEGKTPGKGAAEVVSLVPRADSPEAKVERTMKKLKKLGYHEIPVTAPRAAEMLGLCPHGFTQGAGCPHCSPGAA